MEVELTRKQKTYEASLSRKDLKSAIYIDFEGFMDRPPTLVGCCCDKNFLQVVFDRTLESAALAKGCSVQEGDVVVADLLKRARHERRRIVAFTQYDKEITFNEFSVDLSPVYADAALLRKTGSDN